MYFEKWYPVDLVRLPAHIQDVGMTLFVGDADSIRIGVNVTRDGAEETVTGAVKGIVILPDGSDILPFNGSSDGSRAWIDLPGTALVMSGRVQIALRVYDDGAVTTLLAVSATVRRADADRHFDPDDVVGDITELISEAERVSGVAETAAAQAQDALEQASNIVSYAAQSGQTDAEKAQARANIGAVSEAALSLLTARVDALHGLVDYDYGAEVDNSNIAGGQGNPSLAMTRKGMLITLNGAVKTNSSSVSYRIKINGTVATANTGAAPDSWGTPLTTLISGHSYRLIAHTVSGSASVRNDGMFAVFNTGAHTGLGKAWKYGNDYGYDFFYNNGTDGCQIAFSWARSSSESASFDNWVAYVTLEDITGLMRDIPVAPNTSGTYVLKATVGSNRVPVYEWVSEGSGLLGTPLTLTGGDTE